MKTNITFREVENNGIGFYGLLAGLGVFILSMLSTFFYVEHTGHYVTGMNNQIVWGMPHVFAIFLIVAASGALNVGSIGTVFGKKVYQPMGRLSGLLALSLLVGGLAVLVLDLGHADRLIVAMTTYNFKSIFAWNIILYNGFIAFVAIYLWTMFDRKMKAYYKAAGFAAFTWRLILTAGTGSIFGFLVGRQFYDAAIMGPMFIIMSFSFGLAFFILVLYMAYKGTGRDLGNVVLNRLRYLLGIFVLAVLFFEIIRHVTNLYATEHHGIEQFILTGIDGNGKETGSLYATLFWWGQILLGSLVPLFLIFCKKLANNRIALVTAAALVVLGGFIQLYIILIGGQAYPLVLFPGAEVQSEFFDGVVNAYSPSMFEILLGLGGVAITLIMVVIGTKVLRFLPLSLADKYVDPHYKVKTK